MPQQGPPLQLVIQSDHITPPLQSVIQSHHTTSHHHQRLVVKGGKVLLRSSRANHTRLAAGKGASDNGAHGSHVGLGHVAEPVFDTKKAAYSYMRDRGLSKGFRPVRAEMKFEVSR